MQKYTSYSTCFWHFKNSKNLIVYLIQNTDTDIGNSVTVGFTQTIFLPNQARTYPSNATSILNNRICHFLHV